MRLALVAALALALPVAAEAKRYTEADVKALLEKTPPSEGFAIPASALVAAELTKLVGQVGGRRTMREALIRHEDYRAMIEAELAAKGLPRELAAIPMIESGYDNTAESKSVGKCCAGIWQLTRATARANGLTVSAKRDERRVTAKATVAAATLLKTLHELYGDWGLALAAYNIGDGAVSARLKASQTKDPWQLIQKGKLPRYPAKVMAAALVLANPHLAD